MTAFTFLPIAFTIAACFAYLFLAGNAALDDILARWQADRADRASRVEFEQQQAALRGPRSVPSGRRR